MPWLRRAAALGHWATVAVVMLSHHHYTIDLVGAWAVPYSLFVLLGAGSRCHWQPPDLA